MVFTPALTGAMLKEKLIVVLSFDKTTESAGIPFTVKSFASRLAGSIGSVTLTTKIVGGAETILRQVCVVTEQGVPASETTPSRNVTMAMINVAARFIFTFHYHFVDALYCLDTLTRFFQTPRRLSGSEPRRRASLPRSVLRLVRTRNYKEPAQRGKGRNCSVLIP
jgi:hypothetical protein